MKSKLKKIVIPIFLAVICGALCGRLMFNIYEEKGSSTLNSNVIYLLLDTSYNNYQNKSTKRDLDSANLKKYKQNLLDLWRL